MAARQQHQFMRLYHGDALISACDQPGRLPGAEQT